MLSTADKTKLFSSLESIGEEEVRIQLAQGQFNQDKAPVVAEWLRSCEESHSADSSARREARELETLAIAKSANELASEANSIASDAADSARRANIISIIAAITAIVAAIITIINK